MREANKHRIYLYTKHNCIEMLGFRLECGGNFKVYVNSGANFNV
jgi:hypothetical protein